VSHQARRWLLTSLLVGSIVLLALVFRQSGSRMGALVAHYARAGVLAVIFSLSCLVAGHSLLVRALRRTLPFEEHLAIALALGVFAFFGVSCLFGYAGLYGMPFLVLGPSVLIAFGRRDALRTAARLQRHLTRIDFRLRLGPLGAAIFTFGVLGVALLWCSTLTPQNASYDARWYHLALAEEYVARGGIRTFGEGWVHAGFPHLASLLYAWPFSLPGSAFDHVVCAANLELSVFLMTLVGVAAIVRRCLARRAPLSWVALLLFPGIFCYDSGLVLGADHVAALWAAPIFLVLLRFQETRSRATALLLGSLIAGALNTKYTAILLLPLPIAFLLFDNVRSNDHSRRSWSTLAWLFGAMAVLTAPHWLKNFLCYGDPLFPVLRTWLPAHPWQTAAEAPYRSMFPLYHQPLSLGSVLDSIKTLATFSFVPHDFPVYHGMVPVFGSLFTIFTPLAFLLGKKPRLRWLFAGAYLGIMAWCWLHQLDRYLQVLVPWMAAATAVTIALIWQEGGALRPLVALAVSLQIVWGAQIPFKFVHRAAGVPIYQEVSALLARGTESVPGAPPTDYATWEAVGRRLPRDARLLIHEEEIHVGVARVTLGDTPGDQGAFYWGERGALTPAEVWRSMKARGITHLTWADQIDHARGTIASSLVFFDFAEHYTRPVGIDSGFAIAELPAASPPDVRPGDVAYYPCDIDPLFKPGLYPLEALARSLGDERPRIAPRPAVTEPEAIAQARFLVFDARCRAPLARATRDQFELLARRGPAQLLERRAWH
jgi:hypothetical protein